MAPVEINRKVVLMKKLFVLLFLIFTFVLPSGADIVLPDIKTDTDDNAIVSPAYADEIDPDIIHSNDDEDNLLNGYKNTTLHIFSAILILLIVLASISIRKSIKGADNDNANS
jgi:hypothetical protein